MLPLPKGAVWQALLVLCMVLLVREARSEARVVCYYTNWSVYRPGTAKFNPQNINPYLCTHLIYAFGGFTKDNTLKPFDKYQDIEQGGYAKFTGLKTYNKQLKTMLAIGGWNEASSRFSPLVANPERRQQFIRNILKFLRQNHFDGLDLDWEYPAYRDGGKPRDRDNYAQFVEELRSEFDRESSKTGRPRLLLTMAVPAGIEYIEKGYDIPKLNRYLDWFNILSYDYHSAFEPSVNHHSPLYSLEEESEYNYDTELNIDYSIKFYLKAGADRNKLVLGIPTYGRSYTLINADDTAIGAPADGPGEQGDATREKGYLAYYEICQSLLDNDDWTVVQPNPDAMGPYAHRGDQWVGYDDEAIVRKKAVYVAQNGLGGIMFWSIDNDDFRGTCTGKPYPLIEAAKEALLEQLGIGDNEVAAPSRTKKPSRSRSRQGSSTRNKVTEQPSTTVRQTTTRRKSTKKRTSTTARPTSASRTTTTPSSSLYIGGRTTTPAPPTTPDPGSDFKCEEEGFFSHPRDCKKYFWCLDSGPSNLGIVAHQFTCPSGLYFNTAADSCDFTRNVLCKKTATTTAEVKTTPIPKTTTTTTTTTQSSKRITAATSRNSFLRFTSTTPASIDDDEDEEYEDDEEEVIEVPHDKESEEDPRVIKELIDLIKRVGGLDELEKQLQLQEDGSVVMKNTKTDTVSTTPSSISKSLYAKVLSRPNNLNALRGQLDVSKLIKFNKKKEETISTVDEREETTSEKKYSSINRNSRPSPQNAGIDKLAEFEGFLKEKPKYVTINRPRPTKIGDDEEEDDEDFDEESDVEDDTTEAAQRKSTSAYVNIQRSRPTKSIAENQKTEDTEIAENEEEGGSKISYQSINRNRGTVFSGLKNEETEETKSSATTISTAVTNEDNEEDAINKPKSPYQSLNRNRPSSTAASLTLDKTEKKDDDGQTLIKSTYQSLTRNRSTASPTLDAKDETEDEASIQLRAKSTYQSFTRNRSTFAPSDEETAAQSTISSNLSQNDGKQNEDQVKIKSTYQSLTRNRSTAAPRVTEHDEKEDEATIQLRAKSTYQTFSRNRSTTASSIDKDKEDEDQAQIRTKSTYQSFTRNRSTTGSSVTDIEANEEAEAPNRSTLQFLSRRGSTATPSEAQIEEEGNGSLRSKSSYQTLSRTRGATTSSANDETTVGSISTTNRFKLYDRTRPTTVGSVQTELSSGVEGAKDRDDLSQSITVQYSESTQYTTTPSSTPIQEQDITDRIYANVARRSSTPSPLTITTIPPSSSLPSDTSILELEPAETTIPSLNNPSSIIPAPEILPSLTSEAVPTSEASIPVPTDVLSEKTLTASTTPSGLDTEAYTTSLKTETKSDTNSNLNQDDKVILTEIKTELHKDGKKEGNFIATEQLTNSNSKSESSLIKSNESSLSNIDSVSDLTITRTTSTTKSPVKTDKLTTNRFNTRRKTFSTTSTTTTELPEKEFLGTVSSPRPFGFPRRRTRPQSQTSTTENSPVPEASSSSATPTTKTEVNIGKEEGITHRGRRQGSRQSAASRKTTSTVTNSLRKLVSDSLVEDKNESQYSSRETTGIFSSEGHITRVYRKELFISTEPTNQNTSDSKITYIRKIGESNRSAESSSTRNLREHGTTTENRNRKILVRKIHKPKAAPNRTIDLDVSGSDPHEGITNIEDPPVRNTLIFLKGPIPNPNVTKANSKVKLNKASHASYEESAETSEAVLTKGLIETIPKRKYVEFQRPTTANDFNRDSEKDDDYEDDEEDGEEMEDLEEETSGNFDKTTRKYITVIRPKVTTEQDSESTTESKSSQKQSFIALNRQQSVDTEQPTLVEESTTVSARKNKYVTFNRVKVVTTGSNETDEEDNTESDLKNNYVAINRAKVVAEAEANEDVEDEKTTKSFLKNNYVTLNRVKSVTEANEEAEDEDENEFRKNQNESEAEANEDVEDEDENVFGKNQNKTEAELNENVEDEETTKSYLKNNYTTLNRVKSVADANEDTEDEVENEFGINQNKSLIDSTEDQGAVKVKKTYASIDRVRVSSSSPLEAEETEKSSEEADDYYPSSTARTYASVERTASEIGGQGLGTKEAIKEKEEEEEDRSKLSIVNSDTSKYVVINRTSATSTNYTETDVTTEKIFTFLSSPVPKSKESEEDIIQTDTPSRKYATLTRKKIASGERNSAEIEDEEKSNEDYENDEPSDSISSKIETNSKEQDGKTIVFRKRNYAQTNRSRPTSTTESNSNKNHDDVTEKSSVKAETSKRTTLIRNRSRPTTSTTQAPKFIAEGNTSTKRTYVTRNRLRPSITPTRQVSSAEDDDETSSPPVNAPKRTYSLLSRKKPVITPAPNLSNEDDEEEQQILSSTKRTVGILNRRKPPTRTNVALVKESNKSDDDEDYDEEEISSPSSTTKRTYSLLNRARYPTKSTTESYSGEEEEEIEELFSSTTSKRNILFANRQRFGQTSTTLSTEEDEDEEDGIEKIIDTTTSRSIIYRPTFKVASTTSTTIGSIQNSDIDTTQETLLSKEDEVKDQIEATSKPLIGEDDEGHNATAVIYIQDSNMNQTLNFENQSNITVEQMIKSSDPDAAEGKDETEVSTVSSGKNQQVKNKTDETILATILPIQQIDSNSFITSTERILSPIVTSTTKATANSDDVNRTSTATTNLSISIPTSTETTSFEVVEEEVIDKSTATIRRTYASLNRTKTTVPNSSSEEINDDDIAQDSQTTQKTFTPTPKFSTTASANDDDHENSKESLPELTTRRTFSLLNRPRPAFASTTSRNVIDDEIDEKEDKEIQTTRRSFSSTRRFSSTTSAPPSFDYEKDDENEKQSLPEVSTKRTYSFLNRVRPSLGSTTSRSEVDEEIEKEVLSKVSTTRRPFAFKRPSTTIRSLVDEEEDESSDEETKQKNKPSPTRKYSLLNRVKIAETNVDESVIRESHKEVIEDSTTKTKFSFPNRPRPNFAIRTPNVKQESLEEDTKLEQPTETHITGSPIHKFSPTNHAQANSHDADDDDDENYDENNDQQTRYTFLYRNPSTATNKPLINEDDNTNNDDESEDGIASNAPIRNKFRPLSILSKKPGSSSVLKSSDTNFVSPTLTTPPTENTNTQTNNVGLNGVTIIKQVDNDVSNKKNDNDDNIDVDDDNSRPSLLNFNRRFQKFASRRGGNYKVNATGTTTNTTTDVRNATTTTVNGRRVAVFKIRRPANKSPLFRTDGGEVGERNRTLIELDDSKYTETETIEQTARTTESTVAKRKYTVKRLVRKRPVSSTTPLPIRTRSSTASASTTEEIEDLDLASTTASTLAPKRRFRKVIKKLKVITNATTVAPTRAPFKPIPIASSRTHLLREKDTNATIEDEASSSSTTSNLDARTSKSLDIEESSNSILLETGTSKSTLSELDEASKTIEPEIVATKATPTGIERANSTLAEIEASNSTLLNIEVSNPSLSEARILNTTVLNNSESDSSILNLSVEDKSNSTIQDILNSTLLATENSFGNSTSSPDSGIASNETTTEEAVISTTKSKLFVSRRPYKPTKPSVSAITSTESTSSTPRNYVRKYSSNFTAPKLPSEIDNPVGIIAAKIPSLPSKGGKRFKTNFKSTTARTTPRLANDEEDEEEEEEYEDEDDEVPHKIALIKPNYVLTNRAPPPGAKLESESFEGESDEEYEDDEAPHQAPKPQVVIAPTILNLGGPGQQSQSVLLPNGIDQIDLLKMVGLLPAQLPSQLPTQNLQTATESGAIVRLNNGFVGVLKKSESKEGDDEAIETTTTTTTTTRRLPTNYRITRPSNKPRVVNRPVVTTIHPASLRHAVTNPPKPTTPAAFRTNNTRNYERKYSPSSTEGTIQDNSLLEDLNVDALSARNKKIFEKTSRKHTTAKPKTTQKDQNETDITYNTTQLHNFSGDESDFNNINQFQENVLENSLYPPATPAPSTSTTAKITTLRHIFEINDRGQTTTDQPEYDDRVQFVSNSDPLKLVEINRIVEIYSKENKFKVNQKDHKTQNISSSELKLEQLPTIDHLGEISRIALVNLIDSGRVRSDEVRGRSLDYSGDIKIEGRSTVADYTPTEPIPVTEFTPVRNAIPQSQESQNNRDKSGREIFVPAVISGVETSTISLQGLFEAPRKSKSGRVINSPVFATSLGETQTRSKVINESQRRLDLADDRTTTPIPPTTTTTDQPKPTEQSRSVNYVRPLVPLLRPESNESSPLVISIANLDKVILSRVPKDGSVASSGRINTYIEAPKALLLQSGGSTLQSPDTHTEHYTEPIVETQTSYSSEIHIVRKRMPRKHKRTTHTTHNTGAVA